MGPILGSLLAGAAGAGVAGVGARADAGTDVVGVGTLAAGLADAAGAGLACGGVTGAAGGRGFVSTVDFAPCAAVGAGVATGVDATGCAAGFEDELAVASGADLGFCVAADFATGEGVLPPVDLAKEVVAEIPEGVAEGCAAGLLCAMGDGPSLGTACCAEAFGFAGAREAGRCVVGAGRFAAGETLLDGVIVRGLTGAELAALAWGELLSGVGAGSWCASRETMTLPSQFSATLK